MSEMPWVRFFPSDWLGGTRGLSASDAGVYINLLAMMYERREPLSEDIAKLARLCGASNSAFRKALERLVDDGKIIRVGGGLWNERVEKEQVYRSEKSTVGKQAAEKRWRKTQQNQQLNDANAMRTQCVGNANQKPDTREQIDSSDNSENFINVVPADAGSSRYAFEGKTIKLTERDLTSWRSANPHLALESELYGLDEWAGEQKRDGKNWFHAVSGALAKKERAIMDRIHMARVAREAGPARRAMPDPRL